MRKRSHIDLQLNISSVIVTLELFDDLLEVVETLFAIKAGSEHAIEADAPVQLMLILEAPVTARVPILGEVLGPVLQKLISRLVLLVRVFHYDIFVLG